jgi:GDP-L-fucose synthase
MNKSDSVYIAGHNGLVGSNILKKLKELGYENLIYFDRSEYDLVIQSDVNLLFKEYKPDYVFLAAAKVGGIYANNTFRGDFIYENLMIQTNIIHAAKENDTKKV